MRPLHINLSIKVLALANIGGQKAYRYLIDGKIQTINLQKKWLKLRFNNQAIKIRNKYELNQIGSFLRAFKKLMKFLLTNKKFYEKNR